MMKLAITRAGLMPQCVECGRVFDMTDPTDEAELNYGHDCEEN